MTETHYYPKVGVSTGRAGRVCAQPANRPVEDRVADSQPATDPLRGSVFAGRFAGGCHRFRVRPKPDGKLRKTAKIGEISPDPAKFREDFVKSDYFSPKSCRESLDLVYLCRIYLFWSPKSTKSS